MSNQVHNSPLLDGYSLTQMKKLQDDYSHKSYYDLLNASVELLGLVQLVDFYTSSRLVNGIWRESILDHVYTQDVTMVRNLTPKDMLIGDHKMVMFEINEASTTPEVSWRRNWQKYNKELLLTELSKIDFDLDIHNVQDHWNCLEQKLASLSDQLAPIVEFTNGQSSDSTSTPNHIRRKSNLRKRLLYQYN